MLAPNLGKTAEWSRHAPILHELREQAIESFNPSHIDSKAPVQAGQVSDLWQTRSRP